MMEVTEARTLGIKQFDKLKTQTQNSGVFVMILLKIFFTMSSFNNTEQTKFLLEVFSLLGGLEQKLPQLASQGKQNTRKFITKHKEIYKLLNINDKRDKENRIVKKYLLDG